MKRNDKRIEISVHGKLLTLAGLDLTPREEDRLVYGYRSRSDDGRRLLHLRHPDGWLTTVIGGEYWQGVV